ncbi:YchJ family protein [Hoeflea sp.]|uniref:YchJ family protein n=1 Tax=Hoeflea sp. TaxID=1940281 RepID=UPI001983CC42|nr:YchJ family protein [Hoeflea sp.]MBC7284898.1 YchJ family protein [Hoeflea sp.]
MPECPCGSNLDLATCCGRYHAGTPAPTAEALMRSRYAAYALANLDYIAATCAGPAAAGFNRTELELSQLGTQWMGLEIVGTKKGRETDTEGTVRFTARYRHNGAEAALSETSEFRRIETRWFYWDRDSVPEGSAARAGHIGRNDPCPCGSGKKFKKCCGAGG